MTAIPAEMKAAHQSILPFARTVARRLDTLYEFSILNMLWRGTSLPCMRLYKYIWAEDRQNSRRIGMNMMRRWNFCQKFVQDCQYIDFIIIVDRFVEFILACLILSIIHR